MSGISLSFTDNCSHHTYLLNAKLAVQLRKLDHILSGIRSAHCSVTDRSTGGSPTEGTEVM